MFMPLHVTDDDVNFCYGLECVYVKYKKVVHQQQVNCLIITGFLQEKTWLLKGCDTPQPFPRIEIRNPGRFAPDPVRPLDVSPQRLFAPGRFAP